MIQIKRDVELGQYRITDIFPNIRRSPALIEIFGSLQEIEDVLKKIKVNVIDRQYYMFVSNEDGAISISLKHLRQSPAEILYIDIIHELVHVRQHREGRELFDRSVSYVDRATEIEAYELAVKEARRIGFNDEKIFSYLHVEWITPEELIRLAKKLNVAVKGRHIFSMDYDIYLRRLKSGDCANPFLNFLDIKLDELKEGYARFRMPVRSEFMQSAANMQGGLIVALADESIAHAIMTLLKANEGLTTIELKSNFLAPVTEGVLIAEANVFKKGRTLIIGDCLVTFEDGKAVCRTSATFMLINS